MGAGKRLLLIGSSYSAEDIALQCLKYGAQHIICTWRSKPMGFKWPKEVEERPLVQRFDGKVATFKDGTTAEIDVVMMCTGYLHSYPFLREDLRLKAKNLLYPPGLYKGILDRRREQQTTLLWSSRPVLHLHYVRCVRYVDSE